MAMTQQRICEFVDCTLSKWNRSTQHGGQFISIQASRTPFCMSVCPNSLALSSFFLFYSFSFSIPFFLSLPLYSLFRILILSIYFSFLSLLYSFFLFLIFYISLSLFPLSFVFIYSLFFFSSLRVASFPFFPTGKVRLIILLFPLFSSCFYLSVPVFAILKLF